MNKLVVIVFFAFTALLGINSAQSVPATATPEPRTGHFTCDLDVALASNDGTASVFLGTTRSVEDVETKTVAAKGGIPASANKKLPAAPAHFANLIGRGVADCKNQQGFQFNLPAVMTIALNSTEPIPLDSLRADLEPVSIDRDVNRLFDRYAPHVVIAKTPAQLTTGSSRTVIVKGDKNNLLMQVNLNLPVDFKSAVQISQLNLKFDNEAPDLD